MRKFIPPEYSVVDSLGNRTLLLDIDIMIENGERFFRTFRYKAPVRLDLKIGWYVDCETLSDEVDKAYPYLKERNDVRICLTDAKPVKQIITPNNNYNNDKVRNLSRTRRPRWAASR